MNSKEKITQFLKDLRGQTVKSDKNNLIILEITGKFTELNFEEFLRFQKNTLLESHEYMVISGNILKSFGDSALQLLTKLDLYRREQ
jgi:hypothetical protein